MIPSIRVIGLNKCYFPNITEKEKEDDIYIYKTRLINVYTKNEIEIGEKLKKYNFHIFYQYESFRITYEESEDMLDIDKEEYQSEFVNKYYAILFTYKKVNTIPFYSFFLSKNKAHILLFGLFQTYLAFLRKLLFFQETRICYLLSAENISFEVYGEIPYFTNFSHSIDITKPMTDKLHLLREISKIDNINQNIIPWELYLLFYLFRSSVDNVFMTEQLLNEIINDYIQNTIIYTFLPKKYWDNWNNIYIINISRYIEWKITDIIQDIMNNIDTWDNFALHCLYIPMFINFYKVYNDLFSSALKIFFKNWCSLLCESIHPDHDKRINVRDLLVKATILVETLKWDNNNLPNERISNIWKINTGSL